MRSPGMSNSRRCSRSAAPISANIASNPHVARMSRVSSANAPRPRTTGASSVNNASEAHAASKPRVAAAHRADHTGDARRVQRRGRIAREPHNRCGRGKHDHERARCRRACTRSPSSPSPNSGVVRNKKIASAKNDVMDDEPPFEERVQDSASGAGTFGLPCAIARSTEYE